MANTSFPSSAFRYSAAAAVGGQNIAVDTNRMLLSAEDVLRLVISMRRHFNNIENSMKKTNGYWIGEAGDVHRKLYEDKKEEINRILLRLQEHPEDLQQIAANYLGVVKTNTAVSSQLATNVIS